MVRLSPNEHAKDFRNKIKFGNNHKLWVSIPDKNGIFKWKELSDNLDIYKMYTLFNSDNKKNKYDKLIKLNKLLSKKLKLFYDKDRFIINLEYLVDNHNDEYSIFNYMGDDGFYSKYEVDEDLDELLQKNNSNNYFIITDLDIYNYLKTKIFYIYGIIESDNQLNNIKKIIKDIYKDYKINIDYDKNMGHILITVRD